MIITGASSGIGRAAALRFAAEGLRLALVARSRDRLAALAGEIGGDPLIVPADLTVPDQVGAVARAVSDRYGRIDILFANAGSYISGDAHRARRSGRVGQAAPAQREQRVPLGACRPARHDRAALGDIVVTSSIAGHQAIHWEPVYSASKHAVQSFVHGVRRQVAPHGVKVGSLAPGMVLNELWGITDPADIEAGRRAKRSALGGCRRRAPLHAHAAERDRSGPGAAAAEPGPSAGLV